MSVPISYITVILIWSATPLAIKWSGHVAGFQFGVAARMSIGLFALVILLRLMKIDFPWHARARRVYLVSGITLYVAMSFVYWAAQYIPSGWISLIFGMSPIITGLLMFAVHGENEFSKDRIFGLILGLAGLAVIFTTGFTLSTNAVMGVGAVVVSTVIYSFTAIKVQQHNDGIPALTITAAGLMFAVPVYSLSWYLMDGELPETIASRAGMSILYLAFFGSVIGFALFFYILKHVSASRVSLITLVTPVTALLLGRYLNDEPLTVQIMTGAMMILMGLAMYEFGSIIWRVQTDSV